MNNVLSMYDSYKAAIGTNYTPNFQSDVSRILVLYKTRNGHDIIVERIDGSMTYHKASEFEAVLWDTYQDAVNPPEIRCIGCNKTPDELSEYIYAAKEYEPYELTPTEYVKREEGTYNAFEKNKFYCTPCYIRAGQPLRP